MAANTRLSSDDKTGAVHVDNPELDQMSDSAKDDGATEAARVTVAPAEHLGLVKTIKTYKRASFFCVCAAVGALSDGYQVQMSGSIVALPGFVRTFGELQPSGEYVIDPQYLALWGGKPSLLS